MNDVARLKQQVRAAIDAAAEDLVRLAVAIFEHPELAFEEHFAASEVLRCCTERGFTGARGAGALDTSVRAEFGRGELNLAFCAEYDALPGMGHACGHNLIAGASVAAAIGLAAVADELDLTVTLLGTPAEERGGGKIELLDAGGFAGVHAALMAHPAPAPFDFAAPRTLAVAQLEVSYTGRASHASVAPQLGINAADAMTVAQVSLGLLRQQLATGEQVHGVVTHAGTAANVIPDSAGGEFYCRAPSVAEVAQLRDRVTGCFQAGAVATGSSCQIEPVGQPYAELACDAELSALYRRNAIAEGRHFEDPALPALGSTDMGNVSQRIPAIHPYFGLDCLPDLPHQPGFATHVNTPAGYRVMLEIAKALATTAVDAALAADLRARLLSVPKS